MYRIMPKMAFAGLIFAGLSACVSSPSFTNLSGGNNHLNKIALTHYKSASAKPSLKKHRERLIACVMQIASHQLLKSKKLNTKQISVSCSHHEIRYRTSVMANVNPEFQTKQSVLTNTANSSTRLLYKISLEALK